MEETVEDPDIQKETNDEDFQNEKNDEQNMANVSEKSSTADNNDKQYIPCPGMMFDTEKDAYDFYNNYGKIIGFSIRYQASKKNSDGKTTYRTIVCSKEGHRKPDKRDPFVKNPRAETRTGCRAYLKIKLDNISGKYVVYDFFSEHNHEVIKPEHAYMLPSQRKISDAQSDLIELAENSGIDLRRSYELMGKEVGGKNCLGYLKVDHKNYLRTKRQKELAYGEVGVIMKYFQDQTTQNESFFYAFQMDNQEQITNIFWADAQMIMDYGHFGDVVSFDTTYKVHKDSRPFAMFLGFNHHREAVIFGAALMYDETSDSFCWLFETFLQTMSNKYPKTIFTDQDAAMAKALQIVMPDTFHRLCTWHIMQNALKHMNQIFKGSGQVHQVLGKFFKEPEEEDEWLLSWDSMLDEFSVRENTWLKRLFDLRHKWARPYVRQHWSAGMRSTQLSESTNADLKLYLKSDYSFAQFFTHFATMLEKKRDKEHAAEYSLSYKLPKCNVQTRWLTHAGRIYTKNIFEEFQGEYVLSLEVDIIEKGDDEECQFFIVSPPPGHKRNNRVTRGENNILSCTCKLFEMRGILCCHVVKVLKDEMRVHEIPNIYVLKRWTRGARSEEVSDMHGHIVESDPRKERTSRYKTLNSLLRKISCRGCETEETYKISLTQLKELLKTIEGILQNYLHNTSSHNKVDSSNVCVEDANIHAKGVAKRDVIGPRGRKRIKSALEKNLKKKQKKNIQAGGSIQQQGVPFNHQNTFSSNPFIVNPQLSLAPTQMSDVTTSSVTPPQLSLDTGCFDIMPNLKY